MAFGIQIGSAELGEMKDLAQAAEGLQARSSRIICRDYAGIAVTSAGRRLDVL